MPYTAISFFWFLPINPLVQRTADPERHRPVPSMDAAWPTEFLHLFDIELEALWLPLPTHSFLPHILQISIFWISAIFPSTQFQIVAFTGKIKIILQWLISLLLMQVVPLLSIKSFLDVEQLNQM